MNSPEVCEAEVAGKSSPGLSNVVKNMLTDDLCGTDTDLI